LIWIARRIRNKPNMKSEDTGKVAELERNVEYYYINMGLMNVRS